MSYIISLLKNSIPADDHEAWKHLGSLSSGYSESTKEPAPVFLELLEKITLKYPCITTMSEDEADDCVWGDGPLKNNAGKHEMRLSIVHDVDDVVADVAEQAGNLNLVVFDYQSGQIYRPSKMASAISPQHSSKLKDSILARILNRFK